MGKIVAGEDIWECHKYNRIPTEIQNENRIEIQKALLDIGG